MAGNNFLLLEHLLTACVLLRLELLTKDTIPLDPIGSRCASLASKFALAALGCWEDLVLLPTWGRRWPPRRRLKPRKTNNPFPQANRSSRKPLLPWKLFLGCNTHGKVSPLVLKQNTLTRCNTLCKASHLVPQWETLHFRRCNKPVDQQA